MKRPLTAIGIAAAMFMGALAGTQALAERNNSFNATLTGEVRSVDERTGAITVATTTGIVELRYPPEAVRNLRPGDHVVARLALMSTGPDGGAGTPRDSRRVQ